MSSNTTPLSKEAILKKHLAAYLLRLQDISNGTEVVPVIFYRAMGEMAKQESIEFAKWIGENEIHYLRSSDSWTNPANDFITHESLYNLFTEQRNKQG